MPTCKCIFLFRNTNQAAQRRDKVRSLRDVAAHPALPHENDIYIAVMSDGALSKVVTSSDA